jgi:hypothetical protein
MQQTPAQWQSPPQWTPPPQFRARSVPLQLDASKTLRKLMILIVTISVLTGVLPIACAVMSIVGSAASSASSDDDGPSRPPPKRSKPRDSRRSAGVNKVCKQAKACCLLAMADKDTTACGQIAALNDAKVCKQSLDAFRTLAKSEGKSCK